MWRVLVGLGVVGSVPGEVKEMIQERFLHFFGATSW